MTVSIVRSGRTGFSRRGRHRGTMEPAEGRIATGSPIEFDAASGTYRVTLDPRTDEAVAVVVSSAVAAVEGVDQTALPALNDVVDPEAIDRVLDSAGGQTGRAGVEVAFSYSGYRVTVRPAEVVIRPRGVDLRRDLGERSSPSAVEVARGSDDARRESSTE